MIRASSRKTAGRMLLGGGLLALLIPAVAGCEAGSNAPTLEFHSASSGAHVVFNNIQITNAFVLAAPSGSSLPSGSSAGLFVSFYNRGSSSDTLTSITAPKTAASITLPGGQVAVPADSSAVNLTGPQPKVVLENLTKPLAGGTYVKVTFDFAHAGSVSLQVPVEAQSYQWATFSPAASAPTATATPASTASATPTSSASSAATGTATGSATATGTASP